MSIEVGRWSVPELPGWTGTTPDRFYFLFEPRIIEGKWLAIYNDRHIRTCRSCGTVKESTNSAAVYSEADTVEEAVKLWPYEAAVAFIAAVKDWKRPKMPPRDESGKFLRADMAS